MFKINSSVNIEDNPTDRQERIEWWSQEKLENAKVMVVGAGAIGNETLKNLALLGIGYIFIVDFDVISTSNLSRTVLFRRSDVGKKKAEIAAERVKELAFSDKLKVDWFHGDLVWELGTGIYQEMDIVLGCLDNVETRMAVNRHCWLTNTPWIDAGMKELGMRVEFYDPPNLPCYQCNLTREQVENSQNRYSCDFFKKRAFDAGKMPTTQITSAIVSAIQVQEAVKYLCGQPVATGKKIYFQGKTNDFDVFSKNPNDVCTAHASYPTVTQLNVDVRVTLKEFLNLVCEEQYSGPNSVLDFAGDRTFVKSIVCRSCFQKINVMRPTFRIDDSETICEDCRTNKEREGVIIKKQEFETEKETADRFSLKESSEDLLNLNLNQLGVPHGHIVSVTNEMGDYHYYQLKDDIVLGSLTS